MEVKAGDVVKLVPGATYYNGKSIPGWVAKDSWIVKSVSGDRAVIDKNVSGSSSINSPVNVSQLSVVSGGQNTPEPAPTPSPSPSAGGDMQISERGVELVAKYEGCRLEAYKCPAGVWTIGYGHTAGVKQGDRLSSNDEAKRMLRDDLAKYGGYVNDCRRKGMLTFQPNQNQFDALTSFCYNCGNGNLQKLVSGRSASEVADKMLAYDKGGGKVLEGLKRRREEERSLFLS